MRESLRNDRVLNNTATINPSENCRTIIPSRVTHRSESPTEKNTVCAGPVIDFRASSKPGTWAVHEQTGRHATSRSLLHGQVQMSTLAWYCTTKSFGMRQCRKSRSISKFPNRPRMNLEAAEGTKNPLPSFRGSFMFFVFQRTINLTKRNREIAINFVIHEMASFSLSFRESWLRYNADPERLCWLQTPQRGLYGAWRAERPCSHLEPRFALSPYRCTLARDPFSRSPSLAALGEIDRRAWEIQERGLRPANIYCSYPRAP